MDNLQDFFLELGKGFALLGREYRLVVGNTEQFLDMFFYNVLAQYAANGIKYPVGVSEYELTNVLPEDIKSSMPTIEEIEDELNDDN